MEQNRPTRLRVWDCRWLETAGVTGIESDSRPGAGREPDLFANIPAGQPNRTSNPSWDGIRLTRIRRTRQVLFFVAPPDSVGQCGKFRAVNGACPPL